MKKTIRNLALVIALTGGFSHSSQAMQQGGHNYLPQQHNAQYSNQQTAQYAQRLEGMVMQLQGQNAGLVHSNQQLHAQAQELRGREKQ